MKVSNRDIARLFRRYATLLEIDEANPFRVRAYENAARTVEGWPKSLADLLDQGEDLTRLPGIGADLADKIAEIIETDRLTKLEELQQKIPGELADLTELPGLGAKRVKLLYEELGIKSFRDLERAAESGKVRQIPGFGEKTEQTILNAIRQHLGSEQRIKWLEAEELAEPLVRYLSAVKGVTQVTVAGSYRRRKETVGDLDVLVSCTRPSKVVDAFASYDQVQDVVSRGTTRSTVRLRGGLQVDLRVVPDASYGAALQYFTGSKAHNIALRAIAVKQGLKLNEYGVFEGVEQVAGRTEKEVYRRIKVPYIEPELREDRGEIEAARKRRLPRLIELGEIRGDLHCHTKASDGRDTPRAMAEAARSLGYQYVAISDHTRHLRVAHGLDPARLSRQIAAIDRLNDELDRFVVLKSAEVEILEDGSLDLSDDLLERLDVVIGAVHLGFGLSRKKQTERIIRAMDNPYFNILAHPTGRLLGRREPYAVDMERLMEAAIARGCYFELNAQPERLDLNDSDCRMARDLGLKLVIATDAHSTRQLANMRLGVAQARRGWLGPDDVLNTRSLRALKKLLQRG